MAIFSENMYAYDTTRYSYRDKSKSTIFIAISISRNCSADFSHREAKFIIVTLPCVSLAGPRTETQTLTRSYQVVRNLRRFGRRYR